MKLLLTAVIITLLVIVYITERDYRHEVTVSSSYENRIAKLEQYITHHKEMILLGE